MFTRFAMATVSLATVASIQAQAPTLQISLGVREVGFATSLPFPGLGQDAGATGGIEWVNLDGQTLVLDGTWQPFVFTIGSDPLTAFAGASANGVLEGTWGTIEHIRVRNHTDITDRISLWIDDIESTIIPSGGSPTTTLMQGFEAYLQGDQVTFQEPCFSGSTHQNFVIYDPLAAPPRCVQTPNEFIHEMSVDTTLARTGVNSNKATFQFHEATPLPPAAAVTPGSRWLRMTTFKAATYAANNPYEGNAAIPFDQQSVLLFWMRGEVGSSVRFSGACPGVTHSQNGPLLTYSGSAEVGGTVTLQGDNLLGVLCAVLIGTPLSPALPIDLVGGIPGSQLCVQSFASVPCLGQTTATLGLPIGASTSLNGLTFAAQFLDFDPTFPPPVTLPFGTSNTVLFTPGNF